MNVYEEEAYPFLRFEDRLIRQVLREKVPFLGICLGAQLLAKACGAAVTKSPHKEIGWFEVKLTEAGVRDSLFHGLPETFPCFNGMKIPSPYLKAPLFSRHRNCVAIRPSRKAIRPTDFSSMSRLPRR